MLFILEGFDGPNTHERRLAVRAEHLARVRALHEQGRVRVAGPIPTMDDGDPVQSGFVGSLIIAEFESRSAASVWWENDPYALAGVFARTSIRPFRMALP
jgi:uncharacterized protein